jgi:uncharacterized protein
MPISKIMGQTECAVRILRTAALCVFMIAPSAYALDDIKTSSNDPAPAELFKNPIQALRKGLETLKSGDAASSIDALTYAAEGGQTLAQWKLGRMYADGDGVQHDDYKAFQYFSQLVDSYDDDMDNVRERGIYANAFVAVGVYSLKGIPDTEIAPNPERAFEMFRYAASHFGDPNAQYNLARMYLDGEGVKQDCWQAARWLNLAADKHHVEAEALLGHLLYTGQGGINRQRARGLMWLTLAHDSIRNPEKDKWISELYEQAFQSANEADRQVAILYLEGHHKKR